LKYRHLALFLACVFSTASAPRAAAQPRPSDPQAIERLARMFAPAATPPAIDALFRYQLGTGEGYAQDFAIDTEASVSPWAGSDAVATKSLAPFATKADGSVFALWVVGARNLEAAPVVLLDSEGRASTVLSGSLREFLSLLALGSSLPEVVPGTLEDAPDLENFRRWLRTEFSAGVPPQPAAIVARARAANPGLQRWLEAHPPLLRVPPRPRASPTPAPILRPTPRPTPSSTPLIRPPTPRPSVRPTPRPTPDPA
jgi:hypothetical protein